MAGVARRVRGVGRWAGRRLTPAGRAGERTRGRLRAGDLAGAYAAAVDAVDRCPDDPRVHDLLIGLLERRGEVDEALARCVDNAHRHLHRLRPRSAEPAGSLGPRQRVFMSGFFKSGSSAVMDYLRGFDRVAPWSPTGEWRLVKSVGGLADLGARYADQGKLTAQDLVDLYLHVTGQKITSTPPGRYDRWRVVNGNSARLFRQRAAVGYLSSCLESFLELAELATGASQPAPAEWERFFQGMVSRALDFAAAGSNADLLLLDQGINAWRLPISRYVPASTFVVVHRDPRDQFLDAGAAIRRRGQEPKPAAEFAKRYRRRRGKAVRDTVKLADERGHRFITIGFEDFVHDPDVARELVNSLGLSGRRYRRGGYRPAQAGAAVGAHLRRLDPTEVATIADALPEFLDPRAG